MTYKTSIRILVIMESIMLDAAMEGEDRYPTAGNDKKKMNNTMQRRQ